MAKLDPRTYARARQLYNEAVRVMKECESLARLLPTQGGSHLALFRESHKGILEVVSIVKELAKLPSVAPELQKRIDALIASELQALKDIERMAHTVWRQAIEYDRIEGEGGEFGDL